MNKLAEIFDHKRIEVEAAKAKISLATLRAMARDSDRTRGFRSALLADRHPIALIAEVKRASPSQGLIRQDFDPVDIASAYASAGAACLSVLTDERYFGGNPEFLGKIRSAVDLPLLRKDFIFDSYQIWEARVWGADAVLLIVAALEQADLVNLYKAAIEIGLDVLVEVHNEDEVARSLALGANLIGVNNRDLSTFATAIETSERLIPLIAPYATAVAESALASHADVERVRSVGARAVLIGTTFCAAPDIGAKVHEVMAR